MSEHEGFMREAIRMSVEAGRRGNEPFGALLVHEGRVVARAWNTKRTNRDVTGHAELNLIRQEFPRLSSRVLSAAVLYASGEPCIMCAGAIFWSGIARLVYGCGSRRCAEVTGGQLVVPCREILSRGARRVDVVGPVLEEEAFGALRDHWPDAGAVSDLGGVHAGCGADSVDL